MKRTVKTRTDKPRTTDAFGGYIWVRPSELAAIGEAFSGDSVDTKRARRTFGEILEPTKARDESKKDRKSKR